MAPPDPRPRRLVDHLIALFVPLHLFVVVLHLIPTPPRTDAAALAIPEVAQEIDRAVRIAQSTGLYDGTDLELRADLIAAIREYRRIHRDATSFTRTYLRPLGSLQSWNMFGGNAKQHPKVMMAAIRPEGAERFELFQDGRWDGTHVVHRHRKVRRNLSLSGRTPRREQYSDWLARTWNEAHPDRPAERVRTYYLVRHTQSAADVRSGAPRRPDEHELVVAWKVP